MKKSKVYFTNLRTTWGNGLPNKLKTLIIKAGFEKIDFTNSFTAIKVHFGEPGNMSYLRPNYAKAIVDEIKSLGGKCFVTDCNTLYVGRRNQGLNHLDAAYENGYNPFQTGCHTIIADGIKGNDEAEVPINLNFVKTAKIGRAIYDADIIISLSHFKGHEQAGYGGCLKNLGMGCGSRAGKMEMHNQGKPEIDTSLCISCKRCSTICNQNAFSYPKKAKLDHNKCVGCGRCIAICPTNAIYTNFDDTSENLNCKIAEYAYAVLKNKPSFHISFVIDVSPNCDCHDENDLPIVPDIGIFASFDPVALDMACIDAVNKMPKNPGSWLFDKKRAENLNFEDDHLTHAHPKTNWRACIDHAEKIGLGTKEYEIVEVK